MLVFHGTAEVSDDQSQLGPCARGLHSLKFRRSAAETDVPGPFLHSLDFNCRPHSNFILLQYFTFIAYLILRHLYQRRRRDPGGD